MKTIFEIPCENIKRECGNFGAICSCEKGEFGKCAEGTSGTCDCDVSKNMFPVKHDDPQIIDGVQTDFLTGKF